MDLAEVPAESWTRRRWIAKLSGAMRGGGMEGGERKRCSLHIAVSSVWQLARDGSGGRKDHCLESSEMVRQALPLTGLRGSSEWEDRFGAHSWLRPFPQGWSLLPLLKKIIIIIIGLSQE